MDVFMMNDKKKVKNLVRKKWKTVSEQAVSPE